MSLVIYKLGNEIPSHQRGQTPYKASFVCIFFQNWIFTVDKYQMLTFVNYYLLYNVTEKQVSLNQFRQLFLENSIQNSSEISVHFLLSSA